MILKRSWKTFVKDKVVYIISYGGHEAKIGKFCRYLYKKDRKQFSKKFF